MVRCLLFGQLSKAKRKQKKRLQRRAEFFQTKDEGLELNGTAVENLAPCYVLATTKTKALFCCGRNCVVAFVVSSAYPCMIQPLLLYAYIYIKTKTVAVDQPHSYSCLH